MARCFVCPACKKAHAKWSPRCLGCNGQGLVLTEVEEKPSAPQSLVRSVEPPVESPRPRLMIARAPSPQPELDAPAEELADVLPPSSPVPVPITEIAETSFVRDSTGLAPIDHVLGGGLVAASVVLLASPPGIGKSSLTLQLLAGLGHRCLYVTGEETREQVRGTAQRVNALSPRLFVLPENDLARILVHAKAMRAQTIAIDSIQKMTCEDVNGRAGSPTQLKECTARLVTYAKKNDTAIWIIDHVTGDGDIAGPKTIEHDVDVVLELSQGTKFEGNERILRCSGKNRFGPTNVAGHFELTPTGLNPVDMDGWDEKL